MTTELLNKYGMLTLDEYKQRFGDTLDTESTFYMTFLMQTDYISNKISESALLNIPCKDYTEELKARQECREQIRLIREKEGATDGQLA